MKVQCNVCEASEANVLCCADEAALCWACDERVHAANKFASKHQRIPLSNSSPQMPKCDICQETSGFFFCLEDRALLCWNCDISIHTANSFVSAHQRFLLTGVKVGLEPTDPGASSSVGKLPSEEKTSETKAHPASRKSMPMQLTSEYREVLPAQASGMRQVVSTKVPFAGGSMAGSIPPWHIDEFLGITEFHQNFGYMDNGSSKELYLTIWLGYLNGSICSMWTWVPCLCVICADSGKRGDSDSSLFLRPADEEIGGDECLGQVPETSWAVPQFPPPTTPSGLSWPRGPQNQSYNSTFVPNISSFNPQKSHHFQRHGIVSKRWQQP